jgi:hypothetical protein
MTMNMALIKGPQSRVTESASGDIRWLTMMESVMEPSWLISADIKVARKNDPNMFFST